jgi:hypothetical protein
VIPRGLGVALLATLVALIWWGGLAPVVGQSPAPGGAQFPPDAQVDLASSEMGGRVEWASSQYPTSGVAMNLIARSPHPGWKSHDSPGPHEIVFSFFAGDTALVSGIEINPIVNDRANRTKDVEVWTSVQSPTDGFTRAAAATLARKNELQPVTFAPVEARFVKLRILAWYGPDEGSDAPSPGYPVAASRVRILEGARAGYRSLVDRHPELAAALKGTMPPAMPPVSPAPPPVDGTGACAVADETPGTSNFAQSRHVLVVTDDPNNFGAIAWKSAINDDRTQAGRAVVEGIDFTWLTPGAASPAQLVSVPRIDTVVLAQICDATKELSASFTRALVSWVATGHKLIIQDSDFCAPRYEFLPYPFVAAHPGATGSSGDAGVLENSTLVSSRKKDASYVDTESWRHGPNDLGDSNVLVQNDPQWCGAMWAKNVLRKNGLALAYAHHGRGLIVYDGFDRDQLANTEYQKLVVNELKQPFDPDYLRCSIPAADFLITARPEQQSQPMMPGATYSYPLTILANYGYSGRVALEATLVPADPDVTVTLDATAADLTSTDHASAALTVTAGPTASLSSKAISVRGKDAAGKSTVLCLSLPERRTGGLTVVSGLRKDRKPTKTLEIILDASGSMKALLGKKTRWATAQEVLADVVAKLPADYQVGLRTYGHREASTSPRTCTDTELVAPVGPLDRAKLLAVARALKPRGETPLVYSALQTPGDLKAAGGGIVVLITDGEESCKGDFVAAARALKASGLDVMLNIVGFTLKGAQAQADLKALAESTGGRYYAAQSGAQLSRALLLAAVDRLPYRVVDAKGTEMATGMAGVDGRHELAPGDYTVLLTAGDESLKVPVTLALRQDVSLRVVIKDDTLAVER